MRITKKNLQKLIREMASEGSSGPSGLPAPGKIAGDINRAGVSGDEVLAWLGQVLQKVSTSAAPETKSEPEPGRPSIADEEAMED